MESPPTRAEWIEINDNGMTQTVNVSLRPHGRSGLKFKNEQVPCAENKSPPTRAEWIEIVMPEQDYKQLYRLRPHGRSGLK